jgi:hypothetical protein
VRRRLNPDGNERLTAAVGVLVLVPILVELATVVLGVHTFMSLHVFVGLALIPPVLLKLGSTSWRFARYYTRSRAYVAHGPPQLAMRLLAPLLVAATVALFSSGVAMGILHGNALQIARRLHGPASVVWLVLIGVHVLVYLKRALTSSREDVRSTTRREVQGATWRSYTLAAALIFGLVAGAATIPAQHRWVNLRGHHDRRDSNKRLSIRTTTRGQGTDGAERAQPVAAGGKRVAPKTASEKTLVICSISRVAKGSPEQDVGGSGRPIRKRSVGVSCRKPL